MSSGNHAARSLGPTVGVTTVSPTTPEKAIQRRLSLCPFCWWSEGERCFNAAIGPIPMRNNGWQRLGHFRDEHTAARCIEVKGFST